MTRGVFIGEHHVYASPQIDDFFLASAIYTGGKYRITAADLQAFADWQNARRAEPLTAHLRSAFAFNALGAKPAGQDALTDKASRARQGSFTWINHTWDHQDMNAMSYATAFEELNKNNQYGIGAGFDEYTVENLVTPGISGLDNAEVMRAAFDVGIRQLVSDTSVAGQANPSPNAGYYNALDPGLLMLPRRPVDLYFDVSQPAEWTVEYGVAAHRDRSPTSSSSPSSSDSLARYMPARRERRVDVPPGQPPRQRRRQEPAVRPARRRVREVRGARHIPCREPGDGRPGRKGARRGWTSTRRASARPSGRGRSCPCG